MESHDISEMIKNMVSNRKKIPILNDIIKNATRNLRNNKTNKFSNAIVNCLNFIPVIYYDPLLASSIPT